jgi:hypothetical protein
MQHGDLVTLRDYLPASWDLDDPSRWLWQRCYQVILTDSSQPRLVVASQAILGVAVVLLHGQGQYPRVEQKVASSRRTGWGLETSYDPAAVLPPDFYLYMFCPYDPSLGAPEDQRVQMELDEARGLLGVERGSNIAFKRMFDLTLCFATGATQAVSNEVIGPNGFGADVSQAALDVVGGLSDAASGLGEDVQSRLKMALWWHSQAMSEAHMRRFVFTWTAIEALCMTTSNIRPVNEWLASAYGISLSSAVTEFEIGRLQNVRSDIVHGSQRLTFAPVLGAYADALFRDLVRQALGAECVGAARSILESEVPWSSWRPGHA